MGYRTYARFPLVSSADSSQYWHAGMPRGVRPVGLGVRRGRGLRRTSEVPADPPSDVNHVPDDALAALDAFGEGHLRGDPQPVSERLRSDLRLRIAPPNDGRTARCRFETEHTRTPPTLRDRGSFLATYVNGVDERLREWGIEPPDAYEYVETVDGRHRYAGTLRLP